jgi:thiamine-monophosphate kinase
MTERPDVTMADVGEKAFLRELLPTLTPHPAFVNGFGDDASAIRMPTGDLLVFKIDRAAAPVAARRGWTDYRLWGRLAVTSNCSDLLAAGATPSAVMIALIVPREWSAAAAVETIHGAAEECAARDVVFAGGDTKEGRSAELVGSAVGLCRPEELLTRSGGKPGDLLVLAGSLGGFLGSYLQLVATGQDRPTGPQAERWLDYVAHPVARWAEGAAIRRSGAGTAGMDSSDGLYDAVTTLAAGCGAEIELAALPYHPAALEAADRLGVEKFNLGLGVGDWTILYAVDAGRWAASARPDGLDLTVIGRLTERPGVRWVDPAGTELVAAAVVNEHFAGRQEDEGTLIERLRTEKVLRPR